jgi:hemoglobin
MTHSILSEGDLFQRIGEAGFERLVAAFYAQVPADDILGPMYPVDDMEGAEQRLRDFLVGRFGGPSRYIESRGHPRLRQRHHPFRLDQRARDRWVALMDRAIDRAELPADAAHLLRQFFDQTATFLMNTHD